MNDYDDRWIEEADAELEYYRAAVEDAPGQRAKWLALLIAFPGAGYYSCERCGNVLYARCGVIEITESEAAVLSEGGHPAADCECLDQDDEEDEL